MSMTAAVSVPIRNYAIEFKWLQDNPEFLERPATLLEFVGPNYLNIAETIRPRILEELREILGDSVNPKRLAAYNEAIFTGGIGIGKTTVASIVLTYMVHWCLCLRNPQKFFGLMPGSRIAFMMMSTKATQAREVIFADVKARILYSPWFKTHPFDPNFKNQIRFRSQMASTWDESDIWIVPGDSTETAFEGYNILGGILDEADSHQVTDKKDYAEVGYTAILNRISSRFGDRGFMLIIGQMKSATGFASRKFDEFMARPDAYAARLTIWESLGYENEKHRDKATGGFPTFWFDPKRKQLVSDMQVSLVGTSGFMKVPELYRRQFENNPEKALRDLAGMPSAVGDPFISLVGKIEAARDRWIEHHIGIDGRPMESPMAPDGKLAGWFHAPNTLPRVAHIDIAFSGEGDALGFAMGHVPHMVDIDGELKPYIVIDLLWRKKAVPGQEIFLGEIRQFVYSLRELHKFRLQKVTTDGFQSTDTRQQLERRRFETELVSVDKELLPYHDLREAIYEDRIEFPPYIVTIQRESLIEKLEILPKELSELMDTGRKIDHPLHGSKDVADAVAGVTFTLMNDRRYQRNKISLETAKYRAPTAREQIAAGLAGRSPMLGHPAYRGDTGAHAPVPPTWR